MDQRPLSPVIAAESLQQPQVGQLVNACLLIVEANNGWGRGRPRSESRKLGEQLRAENEPLRLDLLDHGLKALVREGRIKRHEYSPGFKNSEDGCDDISRVNGESGDERAREEAVVNKEVGEPVGAGF